MRIGLGIPHQQPFIEYGSDGRWRVWVSYSKDVQSGTYYELSVSGNCDRVTVQDGQVVATNRVTTGVVRK
jgi:hypothetical protein